MKNLLLFLSIFLMISASWAQEDQEKEDQKEKQITGVVYASSNKPFPGVDIAKIGAYPSVKTDENGEYSIIAKPSDTLVFTYEGYYPSLALVSDNSAIAVYLQEELSQKRVKPIEGALGIKKDPNSITYSEDVIESTELLRGRNPNTIEALNGKVSGLTVRYDAAGNPNSINIRGNRTIRGGNDALIVIDGVISNYQVLSTLDNNIIESITVNKGASGAALYGSRGSNGVILVKTKKSASSKSSLNLQSYNAEAAPRYTKRLKVNHKEDVPDYIEDIENSKSMADAFAQYQANKDNFWGHSAYFVDMYDYFNSNGESSYSQQVFDDVINSDKADYATLRSLAYYLESEGNFVHANIAYNKILNFRSDDAKSYRHMALINQDLGKNQIAFNTLNVVVDNDYMYNQGIYNATEIKNITLHELNNLLQIDSSINTKELNGVNEINTTFDLRIVIDANRDDVNLNIKVVEPYFEISSADNTTTRIGGEMNVLDGLSEYSLRNARKGSYYLVADYSQNPEEVVTFVKVTVYKNYGKTNVSKEVKMIRLSNDKKEQIIKKIEF